MKRIFGNIWVQLFLGFVTALAGIFLSLGLAFAFYLRYNGIQLFDIGSSGDHSPLTFTVALIFAVLTCTFPAIIWFLFNRFGQLRAASATVKGLTFIVFAALPLWTYLGWQACANLLDAREVYLSIRAGCNVQDGVNQITEGKNTKEIECKNGIYNGWTKTYNSQGILIFEGNYVEGKLNGVVNAYYDDGKLRSSITYINGEIEGTEIYYTEDGIINMYVLTKQGLSRQVYYQMPEKYFFKRYDFDLKTQRESYCTAYAIQIGHFPCVDNVIDGELISYDSGGQVSLRCNFTKGVLDGICETFRDGKPHEYLEFKQGKLDGKVASYDLLDHYLEYEGQYLDGRQDGIFRMYDYKGNVRSEVIFDHGQLVKINK